MAEPQQKPEAKQKKPKTKPATRKEVTKRIIDACNATIADQQEKIAERLAKDTAEAVKHCLKKAQNFQRRLKVVNEFRQAIIRDLRSNRLATRAEFQDAVDRTNKAANNYNHLLQTLSPGAPAPAEPEPVPLLAASFVLAHKTTVPKADKNAPPLDFGTVPCHMIIQVVFYPPIKYAVLDDATGEYSTVSRDPEAIIHLDTFEEYRVSFDGNQDRGKKFRYIKELEKKRIDNPLSLQDDASCITNYFRSIDADGEIKMMFPNAMDEVTSQSIRYQVAQLIATHVQWYARHMDEYFIELGVESQVLRECDVLQYFRGYDFMLPLALRDDDLDDVGDIDSVQEEEEDMQEEEDEEEEQVAVGQKRRRA